MLERVGGNSPARALVVLDRLHQSDLVGSHVFRVVEPFRLLEPPAEPEPDEAFREFDSIGIGRECTSTNPGDEYPVFRDIFVTSGSIGNR